MYRFGPTHLGGIIGGWSCLIEIRSFPPSSQPSASGCSNRYLASPLTLSPASSPTHPSFLSALGLHVQQVVSTVNPRPLLALSFFPLSSPHIRAPPPLRSQPPGAPAGGRHQHRHVLYTRHTGTGGVQRQAVRTASGAGSGGWCAIGTWNCMHSRGKKACTCEEW